MHGKERTTHCSSFRCRLEAREPSKSPVFSRNLVSSSPCCKLHLFVSLISWACGIPHLGGATVDALASFWWLGPHNLKSFCSSPFFCWRSINLFVPLSVHPALTSALGECARLSHHIDVVHQNRESLSCRDITQPCYSNRRFSSKSTLILIFFVCLKVLLGWFINTAGTRIWEG